MALLATSKHPRGRGLPATPSEFVIVPPATLRSKSLLGGSLYYRRLARCRRISRIATSLAGPSKSGNTACGSSVGGGAQRFERLGSHAFRAPTARSISSLRRSMSRSRCSASSMSSRILSTGFAGFCGSALRQWPLTSSQPLKRSRLWCALTRSAPGGRGDCGP